MTIEMIASYVRLDYEELSDEEKQELETMLTAAKSFIYGYTGLTQEEADTHEDFPIVVYVLCQDMYDNRTLYVDKNNLNRVVDTILGMHSKNLIPEVI